MPDFSDFISQATRKGRSDVKVNDILRSQSKGGAEGTERDENSQRLKDIAEMFISAERQVDDELQSFGNKEVVDELSKLNRGFTEYANNLSMMKFYLSKFSDTNAEVSADDAVKLQELVDQNARLTENINAQRSQDKDFNDKLLASERRNEFHFRSQGIMEQEQARVQQKYNMDSSQMWEGIGNDIEQFKGQVEQDFKTGLIEGVGGPIGSMARQVLVPGLKAIKDSAIGQKLGPKFELLGERIKGVFSSGTEADKELANAIDTQADIEQSAQEGQEDMLEELEQSNEVESVDNTGDVVKESMDQAAKDIVLPAPSVTKRKLLLEDRAKRSLTKPKQPGIYTKIFEEIQQSNVYLHEIVGGLKDQVQKIDEGYDVLSEQAILESELVQMDKEQAQEVRSDNVVQERILKQLADTEVKALAKTEMIERFDEKVFQSNKEIQVDADEDREANQETQLMVLDELEDLNDKDMGGGGSGLVGAIAGIVGTGLLAGGAAFSKSQEKKRERMMKEENVLLDKRRALAEQEGGAAGEALKQAIVKEEEFGGVFGERYTELSGKASDLEMGMGTMTDEEIAEYKKMQEIIQERKVAEANVIKALYGVGTDAETGNTIVDFEKLLEVETVRSDKELMELLELGDISVRGKTKGFFGKEKESEVIDVNDKFWGASMKDFERAYGVDTEEIYRRRVEEQTGELSGKTKREDRRRARQQEYEEQLIQQQKLRGDVPVEPELKETASLDPSELDREMIRADREQNELNAIAMSGGPSVNTTNNNTSVSGGGQGQKGKKQKLDEISILPEDNFGLVLVNSGMNI
jgi:hypothetical protein